jgi:hypothetical protein
MADFPTVVQGFITRLYSSNDRLHFHTSGDRSPYGVVESDFN